MIVVCGEALVDLVPSTDGVGYRARPGGSPANVAVALGRLGVHVGLVARLSRDHFGQMIRHHLVSSQVDLYYAIDAPERSTVAMVSLRPGGDAEYVFAIEGCADGGWHPKQLPGALPPGPALHVSGSLALAVPSMGVALNALVRRERPDRVICLDPNPRPALSPNADALRERLQNWVRSADIVKASAEDLAWTYPGRDPAEVAERWRAAGPALVVITRGGDGVLAIGPSGRVDRAGPAVEVVDTVGAGDAFTAGLLARLRDRGLLSRSSLRELSTADLADVVDHAQRVAAFTCTRVGADPPWWHEL